MKAVATSHLVTVETVGKYLRDHYSAQAVQLLANLSNDSTPLPVDSEFKDGVCVYSNILLANCLLTIVDSGISQPGP